MYLSFIIPIYNGEAWIEQCVVNLLKMKTADFEIVLVDDGSSDRSYMIGKQLSLSYPQVNIFHQENSGVSTARNLGIQKAKGKYIVFCDVDDSLDIDMFNQLIHQYRNAQENDLLIFGASFDYYYRNILYRNEILRYSSSGIINEGDWKNNMTELYECNVLNSVWAKMFKKDIIDSQHLRFNQQMFIYEDLEFVLRYLKYCKAIYNSLDAIYHYRVVEPQNKSNRRLQRIKSLNQYLELIRNVLNDLVMFDPVILEKESSVEILNRLYLVLVREKISVSVIKAIRSICRDTILWYGDDRTGLSKSECKYVSLLVDEKVLRIVAKDLYIKLRHRVAVLYKIYKNIRNQL